MQLNGPLVPKAISTRSCHSSGMPLLISFALPKILRNEMINIVQDNAGQKLNPSPKGRQQFTVQRKLNPFFVEVLIKIKNALFDFCSKMYKQNKKATKNKKQKR